VIAAQPLAPPAIEQPAPRQASYGLVTGSAAQGTRSVLVFANGTRLALKPLRGRRFSIRVALPAGDETVRVVTVASDGRRSSAIVRDVLALPAGSRPRVVRARDDAALARKVHALARGFSGTAGIYVQSLSGGAGAAWNARATFPGASTLKLAVAATVLAQYHGVPSPDSQVGSLLTSMLTRSDNAAANALEIWLGGSTSGGSHRIDELMRSIGMRDSEMYGGYELRTMASTIPIRADEQPSYGYGKHTTAWDLATLMRSIWLATGNRGPLRREQPGFTAADGRHLLWLLAHVEDAPKLDRVERRNRGVVVTHKAGWVTTVRHDAGLVFWSGGVYVAVVMTWRSGGVGVSADVLAGRVAGAALARFRHVEG
jgi:beta-lactamase class A